MILYHYFLNLYLSFREIPETRRNLGQPQSLREKNIRLHDGEMSLTVRESRKVFKSLKIPQNFKCISRLLPRLSIQTNCYFLSLF